MTDLPDDEAVLERLREWLRQTRAEAGSLEMRHPGEPTPTGPEGPEIGLIRLVEEFTALRHGVKLQTRGARDLREQAEAMLPELRQAIEQFRTVEPREQQAALAAARPLAEAMADLDEALHRGRAELERARPRLVDEPGRALEGAIEARYRRRSWLGRRLLRSYHEEVVAVVRRRSGWMRPELVDALIEGYGLIQARLGRALEAEQIRRVDAIGRRVDPASTTVVEVVDAPDRPPGVVVDELRRGYTWRGRVLRFAEVRASRSPAPAPNPDDIGTPIEDRPDS